MKTPALFMIQSSFAFCSKNASANFCIDLHAQHPFWHLLMQHCEQVRCLAQFSGHQGLCSLEGLQIDMAEVHLAARNRMLDLFDCPAPKQRCISRQNSHLCQLQSRKAAEIKADLWPLAVFRLAMVTIAFFFASSMAAWKPMPLLAPVTK